MLMCVAEVKVVVVALKQDAAERAARYFGSEVRPVEVEDLDVSVPVLTVVDFTQDGRPILQGVGVGAGGDAALRDTSDFADCWRAMGDAE